MKYKLINYDRQQSGVDSLRIVKEFGETYLKHNLCLESKVNYLKSSNENFTEVKIKELQSH